MNPELLAQIDEARRMLLREIDWLTTEPHPMGIEPHAMAETLQEIRKVLAAREGEG